MIVYKETEEWYIAWQRVTKIDNEWYNEWQQVTANDNERYNEWRKEWQWMTTSVFSANFLFFRIKEEPTTKHSKENSLNLEEDLEEELLN